MLFAAALEFRAQPLRALFDFEHDLGGDEGEFVVFEGPGWHQRTSEWLNVLVLRLKRGEVK